MKYSKCIRFLGLRPRPRRGAYDAPPDPLVARGFLPSAIAASRLRRLQFPHGLKSNSIKERWPMRLGRGICARGLGGTDAPDYTSMLQWFCLLLKLSLAMPLISAPRKGKTEGERERERERQGQGSRENRVTKRRTKAIPERRTNRCKGPGLAFLVNTLLFSRGAQTFWAKGCLQHI